MVWYDITVCMYWTVCTYIHTYIQVQYNTCIVAEWELDIKRACIVFTEFGELIAFFVNFVISSISSFRQFPYSSVVLSKWNEYIKLLWKFQCLNWGFHLSLARVQAAFGRRYSKSIEKWCSDFPSPHYATSTTSSCTRHERLWVLVLLLVYIVYTVLYILYVLYLVLYILVYLYLYFTKNLRP